MRTAILFLHELETLVLQQQDQIRALDSRVSALEAAATAPPGDDSEAVVEDSYSVDTGDALFQGEGA